MALGLIPLGGYVKMLGQDDDPRRAEEEAARIRQGGDASGAPALDPRSYPAKPVYARMIIISAGVIMNLIFAVLMGAAAFVVGVPYTPTIVGRVAPGDPAWHAGLQAGDQVLQVGVMRKPNERLYFQDMLEEVAIAGIASKGQKMPLSFRRDGKEQSIEIVGTQRHDDKGLRTMIGIEALKGTTLSSGLTHSEVVDEDKPEYLGLKPGDKILAVDGVTLPIDERFQSPTNVAVCERLNAKMSQPVKVTVQRLEAKSKTTETLELELPPVPRKTLGLRYAVGAITSVLANSPGAVAGVKEGDQVVGFNGTAVQDGLNLHLELLKYCGQEVSLTVKPAAENASTLEVKWTVPALPRLAEVGLVPAPVGQELYGSGLVYTVRPVLSGMESMASTGEGPFQAGDVVKQIKIVGDKKELSDLKKKYGAMVLEEIAIDSFHDPIYVDFLIQILPLDTRFQVSVERDGKTVENELRIKKSDSWFAKDRNLDFEGLAAIHKTDSAWEAMSLGANETWRRMKMVGRFLGLLVTGKVPFKLLGGPGTIFYQASTAAAEGPTKLLLFLVLLSANLAILNSLPIPALDGGHMVFLLTEWIMGKPVDEELQAKITMVGVLGLLLLMAFVIFNDVNFLTGRR